MISAIEPSNTATTLLTTSSSSALPQTAAASIQTPINNLLQVTTQSSTSSLTETLNKLVAILQSLIASIGSLIAGNSAGNSNYTGAISPSTSNSGQFDFLRQVDQEPVTVIPAQTKKTGTNSLNDAVTNSGDSETVVGDTKQTKKNETKKTTPKKAAPKKTENKKTDSKPTESEKTPKRTTLAKSNGEFLWKPKSDKDGKLAILLPKALTGKVKEVQVMSPGGTKVLGKGTASGVGNGEREHFRFSKAGNEFPDGALVVITLKDGSQRTVTIKETSDRTTR